eukprot:TRINITY_DN6469_c1_g1_i2.p3 TRINITY_DN6469_c1_g1~~TRINITY_DN6469_c1_g1_i2.p3  ORF type:complete len:224 (-),score=7.94 TRINITY_DN6469_c1_g1_i2:611-1282(-)
MIVHQIIFWKENREKFEMQQEAWQRYQELYKSGQISMFQSESIAKKDKESNIQMECSQQLSSLDSVEIQKLSSHDNEGKDNPGKESKDCVLELQDNKKENCKSKEDRSSKGPKEQSVLRSISSRILPLQSLQTPFQATREVVLKDSNAARYLGHKIDTIAFFVLIVIYNILVIVIYVVANMGKDNIIKDLNTLRVYQRDTEVEQYDECSVIEQNSVRTQMLCW